MSNVPAAMLLTSGAGLATTFGSAIAYFHREPGPRFMALSLGFSAGVMIHVSYVNLLQGGIESLNAISGWAGRGFLVAQIAFFAGVIVMLLVDMLVSHTYILEEGTPSGEGALKKASLMVALGIAIHNFPEGMATFAATLHDVSVGGTVAFAIALHNIPEGVAVAVPIYAATGNARKAVLWSFLSGVSEPVGAALGGLLLLPFLSPVVLACAPCVVAGFMVYIAFDELLPVAHSYGKEHLAIIGVLAGMAVMAASLALL